MFISDTAIQRPVLTVVAMLILVVFGVVALLQLDTDEFPEIEAPIVVIAIPYPGASPDVVEREVIEPIEEVISGISGVDRMTSNSLDSFGNIIGEFVCETTRSLKSAGASSRPLRRIVRSFMSPSRRPTGAARFCACSALTTSATLTPDACRSRGRISTTSSRSMPPARSTDATPGIARSRRVMSGSAMRVSSAPVSPGEDSVSDTIG